MRNKAKWLLSVAIFASVSSVTVDANELVSASEPNKILEIAKGYGSAKLTTDSNGDPLIICRKDGTKYGILFYGCKNGKRCKDIKFYAGWKGTNVSLRQVNLWNRNKRYGRAYLDSKGDPALDMTVNLRYGVTEDNLDDTFDWWIIALKGFKKEVLESN